LSAPSRQQLQQRQKVKSGTHSVKPEVDGWEMLGFYRRQAKIFQSVAGRRRATDPSGPERDGGESTLAGSCDACGRGNRCGDSSGGCTRRADPSAASGVRAAGTGAHAGRGTPAALTVAVGPHAPVPVARVRGGPPAVSSAAAEARAVAWRDEVTGVFTRALKFTQAALRRQSIYKGHSLSALARHAVVARQAALTLCRGPIFTRSTRGAARAAAPAALATLAARRSSNPSTRPRPPREASRPWWAPRRRPDLSVACAEAESVFFGSGGEICNAGGAVCPRAPGRLPPCSVLLLDFPFQGASRWRRPLSSTPSFLNRLRGWSRRGATFEQAVGLATAVCTAAVSAPRSRGRRLVFSHAKRRSRRKNVLDKPFYQFRSDVEQLSASTASPSAYVYRSHRPMPRAHPTQRRRRRPQRRPP